MKNNAKNNYSDINRGNISLSKNNIIKQINSHTNSNKNIGKFSHNIITNSYKDKANNKITKMIYSNNNHIHNHNNKSSKLYYNNSYLKENQNINYNNFRKSKTSDKTNNNAFSGYKQNQNNKNKKVIITQNSGNIRNYNLTLDKNSKFDNAVFNQVLKYYTIKSESKTLQIEDLSSYLSPIKNLLGLNKSQQNTINSINVNKNYEINDYNKDDDIDDFNEDIKFQDNINLNSKNEKDNLIELYNYQNNINNINPNLVKNSVLNNNLYHSQRNTRLSSSPFNIQIKQISNINDKNKQINSNNINNNIREVSEIDTQISTNNNINHDLVNQQEFNQFRTRKMSLPKGGINLGSIQLKNKILLNILHKRKNNK